jgi:NAD(P)H-dependent FMN reductase
MLIQVISSTTREGRFSERTARWVGQSLRDREDFDVELIDLREYPLPFFDAPPPAKAPRVQPRLPGRPEERDGLDFPGMAAQADRLRRVG